MHLQAWDPYFFSHFGVETKLRSYLMVGARISSPHCSLLLSFSVSNIVFIFFFVNSCLSRSYSFHSHRVNLAGQTFAAFLPFLFIPFSFTLRKISFPSSIL